VKKPAAATPEVSKTETTVTVPMIIKKRMKMWRKFQ